MTRILTLTGRLLVGAALLGGCGWAPRPGPTQNEIFAGSVLREGDAFIVVVDDRVTSIANVAPALGFSAGFEQAGLVGADTIAPGDTLALTIFENVEDGLIARAGTGAAAIQELQVDSSGFIFVPYVGRIRAAGNSPEAVRRIVADRLGQQTPDPQVQVVREAGDGTAISIQGEVGAPGVYALERPTRTLAAMIAAAGGVSGDQSLAQVTLVRGSHRGSIWYDDLFDHPSADIALRPGDRILVRQDDRAYTALGATGEQRLVPFERRRLSAVEALGTVGGLNPTQADPTGVFVFREEPELVAGQILGRSDLRGEQRVVYVLDLTRPNGLFFARDFQIRDGDLVYVTQAPIVQFNSVIASLSGSLGAVNATTNLGE